MSQPKKVVVIGGVAAGPKVGSKIIRLSPDTDVTLIEQGEFLAYAGCGLPYYVSGVVKEQKELMSTPVGTVRDCVFFQNVKNVHVYNHAQATEIDRAKKIVTVKLLQSDEIQNFTYDTLVLATGASPVKPPIEGIDLHHVFTLHGVEDAEGIKTAFSQAKSQDVTIVGGGLIGIEMAEAFYALGARVTIVEKLPQILPFLDPEIAQLVANHLESKGVRVRTNTTVTAFVGDTAVEKVIAGGKEYHTDIAIIAIGVKPNSVLGRQAGLDAGKSGGLLVNAKMQTSDPDIYAAGDCVETKNILTGKQCFMPLGSTANKQGRVVANNICGVEDSFPGVLNTAICKVFDYGVATTGLSEKEARQSGYDVVTVLSPAPDRAHFYPEAKLIIIKLVVDRKNSRLLGMQIIGPGNVDKRIDIAVTAISAGMTVDTIAGLDLAYAPPYSPAMDNIITAANIARNKLAGYFSSVTAQEVKSKIDKGEDFLLLDVRSPEEYDMMHIENAKLIPLGKLRQRYNELPQDKEIITFCKISLRGYEAALILKSLGFKNVKVMDGGILVWPYPLIKK